MTHNKFITLAKLLRNEYRPVNEIGKLRDIKLKQLIYHAYYNVPFYRERFDGAGIRPDDIQTANDLQALPVIRKRDLIDEDPLRIRDPSVSVNELVERSTSGSSGIPFRFYVDKGYDQFCKAQFVRPYFSNGRKPLDKALTLSSRPPPPRKWFQQLGLLDNIVVPSHLDGEQLLSEYLRIKPEIVTGYPSTLTVLADAISNNSRPLHPPKIVFTDSELLAPFIRESLSQAFQAPVIDIYGTIETENIAWQCAQGSAYHYASDCAIFETLVDGKRTEPDEPGVLVCTVLNSLTMPFIRYEIGDLVTLSSQGCDCGRTLPLISAIEGREMDQVVLPDGRRVSPMAFLEFSTILPGVAREYQIIQNAINDFTVLIDPIHPLDESERHAIVEIARKFNSSARVQIETVDCIPREPSGKRRTFISRVQ